MEISEKKREENLYNDQLVIITGNTFYNFAIKNMIHQSPIYRTTDHQSSTTLPQKCGYWSFCESKHYQLSYVANLQRFIISHKL